MQKLLEDRKIAVLAEDMYEDVELWYPVLRLREEGATVIIAGTGKPHYTGKNGLPVSVDDDVEDLAAASLDALVIPGGYAPDKLRRYDTVLDLVRQMDEQQKPVAAICHAPWVPVSAGIVEGRRMTCFPSLKDDIINAGANYEDSEVVRDRNLITSRKPDDLGAFCREIIAALAGEALETAAAATASSK